MNSLILYEDEHLLAVNKPSGINTHKPDSYAPDGLYEWFTKHGRKLSILHRLDKDTSGVMLFGKTPQANQSLARQFETHGIKKEYLLLSEARPTRKKFRAHSADAVTEFELIGPHDRYFLTAARPITGKTHQVRRQAAENGFPILGDAKYGGALAPRLMLHAHRITFEHPASKESMTIEASVPAAFDEPDDALVAALEFRELLFGDDTNAFRLVSGAADGFRDVIVDNYGGHLLTQWQTEGAVRRAAALYDALRECVVPQTIYEQIVTRQKRTTPGCVSGQPPGVRLAVRENGLTFLVSFDEGLATGIFLDQRENRRRLLTRNLAGKTVLNCFAYTCAFSVSAANAGAGTTSVDLSRHYLEWGKDNFRANGLSPGAHEFLVGDVFEWLRRFAKRRQAWDVVLLDPPTFSTTKKGRRFQAARDYGELSKLAMPLVKKGGTLFASTNQRTIAPDEFERTLREAARERGRAIAALEFETVPFDFRVADGERPHLKTLWARLE